MAVIVQLIAPGTQSPEAPECSPWFIYSLSHPQSFVATQDVPTYNETAAIHSGEAQRHAQPSEVAGPTYLVWDEWHSVEVLRPQVFCHLHEVRPTKCSTKPYYVVWLANT